MSALRARVALVSIAAVLSVGVEAQEVRLTPPDISTKSSADRVAGTSGVAGIVTTVLAGDPSKAGPYTIALQVPAHVVIAAHTHRDARSAVVISGTWWFGYGPANTPDRLKALPPGSFYTEPAGQPHFARTGDTPVVVYISGIGPSDTRYVDAAAAPRTP